MKKFLALYMAPVAAFDAMRTAAGAAEMKTMNASLQAWGKAHEKAFADNGGPVGKNKRVAKAGIQDVRNDVGGYSIVLANSLEEAAKLFQDNPFLKTAGAYMEIMECTDMAAM